MEQLKQLLAQHFPAVAFTDDEVKLLVGISKKKTVKRGDVIFHTADPGDSIFLVISGSIDLYTHLKEKIEHTLMTVRAGGFVGALALLDSDNREVNARAAEDTELYVFERQALDSISTTHHNLGLKLIRLVSSIVAERLRIVIANLHQNLEWTLQVSGVASLDIGKLIVDQVSIEIELINGKQLAGTILKAENHSSGFELFLATDDGNIHFIPYHAIVSACLPGDGLTDTPDELSSY